jgi:hypothetical protein
MISDRIPAILLWSGHNPGPKRIWLTLARLGLSVQPSLPCSGFGGQLKGGVKNFQEKHQRMLRKAFETYQEIFSIDMAKFKA